MLFTLSNIPIRLFLRICFLNLSERSKVKYFLNLYKVTCLFSSYKNHFIIIELGSYFPVKIKYKNKIPKIINIITDKHPKENILKSSFNEYLKKSKISRIDCFILLLFIFCK